MNHFTEVVGEPYNETNFEITLTSFLLGAGEKSYYTCINDTFWWTA